MTLRRLYKHLGQHQEQLALFALPSVVGDTEDDSVISDRDVPRVDDIDEDELTDTCDFPEEFDPATDNQKRIDDESIPGNTDDGASDYETNSAEIAPSKIAQDFANEDIFNPNLFTNTRTQNTNILEWRENRHQANFFNPEDLLDNDNLPKIDEQTEVFAPEDLVRTDSLSTVDHQATAGPSNIDFPMLNLIQPTPPGSRPPSMPPSPTLEPVGERAESKPRDNPRTRITWGEHQFHHFEAPTPEFYTKQYIMDHEIQDDNEHTGVDPEEKLRAKPTMEKDV
jgi:hypothetical protein